MYLAPCSIGLQPWDLEANVGDQLFREKERLAYRVSVMAPSGQLCEDLLIRANESLSAAWVAISEQLGMAPLDFLLVQGTRVWFDSHPNSMRRRQVWMVAHEGAAQASKFLQPRLETPASLADYAVCGSL